ncbi:hypothetical protein BaRGS_00013483 [Batillaria attramentaria]|uniref:G-protein coupled receptors family 1 profile domain-containing protein n=1 Tax=Batillaria attramentaria TaxID=370345 RepID=A0ABD0L7P6_9CAEN
MDTTTDDTTTLTDYTDHPDDYDYPGDDLDILPLSSLVPAVVLVTVLVAMAVIGNLLVLWSYARDKGLQTVSNLYIVQLAVCDFLLGAVSMPVYLIHTALQFVWPFGTIFCKVYLVSDFTMCSLSVLLVILISQDQLLILRKGALYATTETKPKAYVKIALAWILGFLLYGPAIIGWDHWVGYSSLEPGECDTEFYSNYTFTLVTAMLEFTLSSIVLILLNGAVYWEIRKRTTKVGTSFKASSQKQAVGSRREAVRRNSVTPMKHTRDNVYTVPVDTQGASNPATACDAGHGVSMSDSLNGKGNISHHSSVPETGGLSAKQDPPSTIIQELSVHSIDEPAAAAKSTESNIANSDTGFGGSQHGVSTEKTRVEQTAKFPKMQNRKVKILPHTPAEDGASGTSELRSDFSDESSANNLTTKRNVMCLWFRKCHGRIGFGRRRQKFSRSVRKDLKAAKALFTFVFAFLCCWTPYTIATVIVSFCDACVNEDLYEFFIWLLWAKAAINPFLYAANNARFRMNFAQIVGRACPCCKAALQSVAARANDTTSVHHKA